MDHSLSFHKAPSVSSFLPSAVKNSQGLLAFNLRNSPSNNLTFTLRGLVGTGFTSTCINYRKVMLVKASAGASHIDYSRLNSPLEPSSSTGKFLTGVLQNQRQFFHLAAADELKQLASDRDAAVARMNNTSDSNEACLHRRIAKLKEQECQAAIEDIMYLLIYYKFSEIRVPFVPRLSRCIRNCRLEIWPSKDWELESIHKREVLEIVREHVSNVIGLRANSGFREYWTTAEIGEVKIGRVYVASILYGYFLKSASFRHRLERCLYLDYEEFLQFPALLPSDCKNLVGHVSDMRSVSLGQGPVRQKRKIEEFRCYVTQFDPETLQRCARLKSKEAVNLIQKHSSALFENVMLETDGVIISNSSIKRLIMEAVAFGSFLWDIEEYVGSLYKLKEN